MPSSAGLRRRRDLAVEVAGALVVLVLSVAIAVLALATADGVTRLSDIDYRTEFISAWWWLAFPLVGVPAATSRRRLRAAVLQTAALVLPQYIAAAICVARYRSSGWSDGLEVFAFVHPLLLTGIAAALVMVLGRR